MKQITQFFLEGIVIVLTDIIFSSFRRFFFQTIAYNIAYDCRLKKKWSMRIKIQTTTLSKSKDRNEEERRQWRVFIVNFEHISHLPLVLPLFTLKREMFAEHRPILEQNSHGNTSTVILELPRRHLAAQS